MDITDIMDALGETSKQVYKGQVISDVRLVMKKEDLKIVLKEFKAAMKGNKKKYPHLLKIFEAFQYTYNRPPGTGAIAGVSKKSNDIKTFAQGDLKEVLSGKEPTH